MSRKVIHNSSSIKTCAGITITTVFFSDGFFDLKGDLDTYRVKLCFQVFLESQPGVYNLPLDPVFSNIICDKKIPDLVIKRLSRQSCYATGGVEMILLCEKVSKCVK